ncbi:uncharacterized protein [Pleurodeles waltl]|uniref:uncharacterized protein n=1 Tax=Pleurodeles waltl TaxID=8319 RepID=UPI003709C3F4
MEVKPSLEDMIKQLAEGQRHLQLVWEAQQREAKEDREALQSALKSQATIMASNQLVHENALKKMTDTIAASKVHPNVPSSVLQKYQEGEDPDSFFTNFERVASSAQWPEDKWGQYIAPLLTGTLQSAYQAANPGGTTPYSEIKKSVLERVGHDTEYYRTRFRKIKWGPNEDPRTYYYRVKDLGLKWLGPLGTDREDVIKIIVLEQYLDSLPSSTRNWIRQHPKIDTETAVDLACAYHRSGDVKHQSIRPVGKPPITPPQFPPRRTMEEPGPSRSTERSPMQQPQCFSCGEWGHIARGCPKRHEGVEPMEIGVTRGRVLCLGKSDVSFKHSLRINGLPVMALIDSGCSQSVIRRSIIHPVQPTNDQWVTICCIHGDRAQYPLSTVEVEWNTHLDLLPVGLMDNLIEECVIGTDYQRFHEILDQTRKKDPVDEWWGTAPFWEASICSSPTRKKLTRRERRAEKHRFATKQVQKEEGGLVAHIETAPISFRMSQHEDPTLGNAWKNAKPASTGEVRHIPGSRQCPADFLSRCPDSSVLYQSRSWEGVCRRASLASPTDVTHWRSPDAFPDLRPRRQGNAWRRRRQSAPDFRVAGIFKERDAAIERGEQEEKTEPRRYHRPREPEGKPARTDPDWKEAAGGTRPGEDETACHGPGGSWLHKVRALFKGRHNKEERRGGREGREERGGSKKGDKDWGNSQGPLSLDP